MIFFLLAGCSQSPSVDLPAKMMPPRSVQGQMIQYGDLRGYLLKGKQNNGEIWVVPELSSKYKECAQKQHTPSKTVLVIAKNADTTKGVEYMKSLTKSNVTLPPPIQCSHDEKLD